MYDTPKFGFIFTFAYFAVIFFLLYKGSTTGCNARKNADKENVLDEEMALEEDSLSKDTLPPSPSLACKAEKTTNNEQDSGKEEPSKIVIGCPACGAKMRVPHGRTLIVSCPKCRAIFKHSKDGDFIAFRTTGRKGDVSFGCHTCGQDLFIPRGEQLRGFCPICMAEWK